MSNLTVKLGEPALVKRSRWYCWFPSLIRQANGVLWAVMSAYADAHVSDSICYLSRSRDEGRTWEEPRVIGDAGLSHLLLEDGSALVMPYYLRPRGEGVIGAPCNLISPSGELSFSTSGVNVGGWPRPLKPLDPNLATAGFVFNGQVVRGRADEYLATLYGTFEGDEKYSLLLAESPDGYDWRIRATIAGPECPLEGSEGPCESAICRLRDGRLMCVFRMASHVPYGQTWSEDEGWTWTQPVAMPARSVEPSLQVMPDGAVVLSGGRGGVWLWVNSDGTGEAWEGRDVLAHHNACRPEADAIRPEAEGAWAPREEMIRRGVGGVTSSYTELARLDDHSLLLIYDRLGLGWHQIPDASPETNSVWVVRVTLETKA